jgi:hypothetical protein
MEAFYKNWLDKNKAENTKAKTKLPPIENIPLQNTLTSSTLSNIEPQPPALLNIEPQPSTSSTVPSTNNTNHSKSDLDISLPISYENDIFELILQKTNHIRQKKFNLEDHLFHMKIRLKNANAPPPLLRDVLDFLNIAFNQILTNVRQFYNPQDHNVAYLTLFQTPMINGLNTGNFFIFVNYS